MIRLLAVIEAASVTGPAKNLLDFWETVKTREPRPLELEIVTFRRGAENAPDAFLEATREAGIPTHVIGERGRLDLRNAEALRAIVRERAAAVLQTHSVKSHFLLRVSGIWREMPWVAFHHGYTTTDLKMRVYNLLDRWSLRRAQRILTVSRAFERELVRTGAPPDRILVLHNTVDPRFAARVAATAREAARSALGIGPQEHVVLAVGRLSHEKAIPDLVEAVAALGDKGVRLVVVGDGPERPRVEAAAAARGVRLTMAGQVRDVAPFYAMADVLAMPSLSEGSPNALLEAMAAGVPVAATAAGGVPEIAANGETALLVQPCDPRAMAGAIRLLLDDSALAKQLAANARARVASHFSPESRADALLALYESLAG